MTYHISQLKTDPRSPVVTVATEPRLRLLRSRRSRRSRRLPRSLGVRRRRGLGVRFRARSMAAAAWLTPLRHNSNRYDVM